MSKPSWNCGVPLRSRQPNGEDGVYVRSGSWYQSRADWFVVASDRLRSSPRLAWLDIALARSARSVPPPVPPSVYISGAAYPLVVFRLGSALAVPRATTPAPTKAVVTTAA